MIFPVLSFFCDVSELTWSKKKYTLNAQVLPLLARCCPLVLPGVLGSLVSWPRKQPPPKRNPTGEREGSPPHEGRGHATTLKGRPPPPEGEEWKESHQRKQREADEATDGRMQHTNNPQPTTHNPQTQTQTHNNNNITTQQHTTTQHQPHDHPHPQLHAPQCTPYRTSLPVLRPVSCLSPVVLCVLFLFLSCLSSFVFVSTRVGSSVFVYVCSSVFLCLFSLSVTVILRNYQVRAQVSGSPKDGELGLPEKGNVRELCWCTIDVPIVLYT